MIEIKKPGSTIIPGTTSVLTKTVDLIAESVDFTTLRTHPFRLIDGVAGKTIVPFIATISYYSIGTLSNGFQILSEGISYDSNKSLFIFLSGAGVVADQSGIVTFNIFGNAPFVSENNAINQGLLIYTNTDVPTAQFNKFIISITYYLIDNL